jgi:RNA-directed DNA polymerase
MALKPRKLFEQAFRRPTLETLFTERIKKTRAIGRDGMRMVAFEKMLAQEIDLISTKVSSQTYKFTRYKDKLVSKGAGKHPRVLSIPTVRDRLTLRAVCEFLAAVYKDAALRKPHSYIKSIRERLPQVDQGSVFLRLDIENYYGSIDKSKLLKTIKQRIRIKEAIHLISEAISTPTLMKGEVEPGIPQGLSISNILAAVYLADCDKKMAEKWTYYRYVDDILIICKADEVEQAHKQLIAILRRKGLRSHKLGEKGGKSYISKLEAGVDYLGFNITPKKISVRQSSYRKMFTTIGSVLTEFRYRQREPRLIWRLNLKISGCRFEGKNYGWMFFFLQTDDVNQLARLDNFIRLQLKQRGLGHLRPRIKRFVKTYHEIRFNLDETRYVPDFDNMSIDNMREMLRDIRGTSAADLAHMSDQEVHTRFFAAIRHEIIELERDLMESLS